MHTHCAYYHTPNAFIWGFQNQFEGIAELTGYMVFTKRGEKVHGGGNKLRGLTGAKFLRGAVNWADTQGVAEMTSGRGGKGGGITAREGEGGEYLSGGGGGVHGLGWGELCVCVCVCVCMFL